VCHPQPGLRHWPISEAGSIKIRRSGMGGLMRKKERRSFLKKKNQKTFGHGFGLSGEAEAKQTKVFCFFFSKKKSLLSFSF
jgi:hypothetical protein